MSDFLLLQVPSLSMAKDATLQPVSSNPMSLILPSPALYLPLNCTGRLQKKVRETELSRWGSKKYANSRSHNGHKGHSPKDTTQVAHKPLGDRLQFSILLLKRRWMLRGLLCALFECIQLPGGKTEPSLYHAGISRSTLQNHSTRESHQQLKQKGNQSFAVPQSITFLSFLFLFAYCGSED